MSVLVTKPEQLMTSLVVEDMEPPIAHNQRAGSRRCDTTGCTQ